MPKSQAYIAKQQLPRRAQTDATALIDLALELVDTAAAFAVVPVSRFKVGAVAIDDSGNLYLGANQEFAGAAMTQTIHAEQSAIANAWRRGARRLAHIAINHTPCGHCRQFMNELQGAEQLQIHLPHRRSNLLAELLPQHFGPADLGITERIFAAHSQALVAMAKADEPMTRKALLMARRSYAPYSGAYAGVCLADRQGNHYTGAYLENAAFNPALPALQMAINELYLATKSPDDICAATLVCIPDKGHEAHTQALWAQLSTSPLEIIAASPVVISA